MQSPIIHQQLILSTERLRDLHRSMQTHLSAIPAAEMEAFLAEIRRLYELALQLNYQNAMQLLNEMQLPNIAEMKFNTVVPEQSPIASTSKTTEVTESVNNIKTEPTPIQIDPIRKEEISEIPVEVPATSNSNISIDKLMADISKVETAAELNQIKKSHSDIHEMFEASPTIAHKFEEHETLGHRIAMKQNSNSVSDQLNKIPVKDIKAAIGLNEKFQFINQLFNGDSQKYNASVDHLNSCNSIDTAHDFLKNISVENNWEKQASIASVFMDIIERRYIG